MTRAKGLPTVWTQHIKDVEAKKDFEGYLRNSKEILEVLDKILDKKVTELNKTKDEDYDKASWAYYQADHLGQIRAYNYIKGIIDL